MLKLIYLARRKPGFTFDDFVRRWRMHGARGMEQSLWRFAVAYVQAEPLRNLSIEHVSDDFDAVACYMVHDEMFTAMTAEDMPGANLMAEDELETFSAPIPTTSLWVTEERLVPGELGGATAFLFFAGEADARRVAEQLSDRAWRRLTLNLRDDGVSGPDMNSLPFAAVLELSMDDRAALLAMLDSLDPSVLATAQTCVATREVVLWDRLDQTASQE